MWTNDQPTKKTLAALIGTELIDRMQVWFGIMPNLKKEASDIILNEPNLEERNKKLANLMAEVTRVTHARTLSAFMSVCLQVGAVIGNLYNTYEILDGETKDENSKPIKKWL